MNNNCIFGYNQGDGMYNFQLDVLKLLIEDRDFFMNSINSIDQNTFVDWVLRGIVGLIKDNYRASGLFLDYDGLECMSAAFFRDEFERKEAIAYLKKIKERALSDDRVAEVKYCFRFWNTFFYLVRLQNKLADSLKDGITNPKVLEKVAYATLEDAEVLKGIMNGEVYCGDEENWNW